MLYFTANGHEAGEDPYYTHLYRVGLDGSGLKLLTPENFTHALSWPDSGKYFVDTYSRVDTAPKSALLDGQGTPLGELETTDVSQLRSEEHTSELQSHSDLVCRLLLEKKKNEEKNQ